MKNIFGLLLLTLLLCPRVVTETARTESRALVITQVTVIDATGAPAQPDMTVVINGNRIAEVGKSEKVRVPGHARIVDARGKFLIPGLWDMHVHWYEKDYLPLFIANGVTGVRIMWGMPMHHQWRKEIEARQLLGPHMLIASPIMDGPKPVWQGSITVANASEARAAVIKAKQDGADFIKVYSLLPRDAYFAIADESKKQGIPFEGHVPISVSVEEASNAGQKTIEHLTGVLSACSTREADLLKASQETLAAIIAGPQSPVSAVHGAASRESEELALKTYSPPQAEALFAELKRNETWQCPTLTVLRSFAYLDDPSFTSDPRLKYMPPDVRASWDPKTDFRLKTRTAEDWKRSKDLFSKDAEIVGLMQRAGVRILAGTDTLNPYCFPGFSLHDELGLLVKAGLSPMEALQTATLNPAKFMSKDNDFGTVETGKIADLVLLDANPLNDIANTKRIDAVVLGGRFFPRASLDGMLASVEALASRKSIAEVLLKIIQEQNVEAAIKRYHELKAAAPTAYDFGEAELNGLGYQLLEMRRFNDALRVFALNVEAYPSSYSAYDRLGEAEMDNGDKELAIKNYRKSLELNRANENAKKRLKQLGAQ